MITWNLESLYHTGGHGGIQCSLYAFDKTLYYFDFTVLVHQLATICFAKDSN